MAVSDNSNLTPDSSVAIKAMILTVGGTPAPLIVSIREHRPDFVLFIATHQTYIDIPEILDALKAEGIKPQHQPEIISDKDDLIECYEKSRNAIEVIQKRGFSADDVLVGYTGGTKSMSVAISLAAVTAGFKFTYVGGSERTKDGKGVVIDGSEKVHSFVNPWDFLGVDERRKVNGFFNACQFKSSREILQELASRATQRKNLYERLALLVDGYLQWDLFRHCEAMKKFNIVRLNELVEDREESVRAFAIRSLQCENHLKNLMDQSGNGSRPCIPLALDLFANAERRIAEGKTDDAILRLYRLVEMLAQMRLKDDYGIDVSNVRHEDLPISIKEDFINKYTAWDNKLKLPQYAAYSLLKEKGDPLGTLYRDNEKDFRAIQGERNGSYLAHGFSSSSDKTYQRLRNFIISLGVIDPADTVTFPTLDL